MPSGIVRRYYEGLGQEVPENAFIAHGVAVPVLIAIGAGLVMTFIATRTELTIRT